MPNAEQIAKLDALEPEGVDHTWITETVSMASSTAADSTPALAAVKAVDPTKYPYYGEMKLQPEMPLRDALTADSVAAGRRPADPAACEGRRSGENRGSRFQDRGGDCFRTRPHVGQHEFRAAADDVARGVRAHGADAIGSRGSQRYLFKLNAGAPGVEQVRREIRRRAAGCEVADFRQSHPIITDGLDQATTFLSLISLIALIVGAIGVAMAMHAHLQQKMDHIAVMKSLGATSGEIMRIYTIQTLMLGLVGGLAGVAVGRVVEQVFPLLITRYFSLGSVASGWHIEAAGQGIVVGVLTTLLFTVPPLLAIRKIRPAMILRRDMPEARADWRKRFLDMRGALVAGGVILIGIGAIAAWLAESVRVGGISRVDWRAA